MSSPPLRPHANPACPKQHLSLTAEPDIASSAAEPCERPFKAENDQYSGVPSQSNLWRSSDSSSNQSLYSADDENERRTGRLLTVSDSPRLTSRSPTPLLTWRSKILSLWTENKGLAFVSVSQLFGVMMNVSIKILEKDGRYGDAMDPFQILFARMVGTLILGGAYQWLAKVEHAPFGPRCIWGLLLARGIGGFFGVYGVYYSLRYLPLSDATVITFLAPTLTCWACAVLVKEPFPRSEQIAGVVSFLGVVLIARPTSLLPHSSSTAPASSGTGVNGGIGSAYATSPKTSQDLDHATPSQRLAAVGVALIGVGGSVCAYTTIRWIGQRAHPLISVNSFAAWSMVLSLIALLTVPGIGFRLPASLVQWAYLTFVGICGFVMQFLLTAGLAYEKSSRATNMVYTQMLFALAFDKLVWNTSPGLLSILGSSLILGSALYVAVHKNNVDEKEETAGARGDEEEGLASECSSERTGSLERGREPLRGIQEVQLRTLRV